MPSHQKTKQKKKGCHKTPPHNPRSPSLVQAPVTLAIPLPADTRVKGLSQPDPPKSSTQQVFQDFPILFQVLHLDHSSSGGPIGLQ